MAAFLLIHTRSIFISAAGDSPTAPPPPVSFPPGCSSVSRPSEFSLLDVPDPLTPSPSLRVCLLRRLCSLVCLPFRISGVFPPNPACPCRQSRCAALGSGVCLGRSTGILEIVVSIPTAYFFFRVPGGLERTGILQFLSIFVIIGIGVDDVFVFFDTFRSTRAFGAEVSLAVRLSHAYRWQPPVPEPPSPSPSPPCSLRGTWVKGLSPDGVCLLPRSSGGPGQQCW